MILEEMEIYDYEQVVFCQDKNSGLKAIIAIHDTTLGPALGGCRMWPYESEEEALKDVLRLSRGMTYKNSAAGLNLGGAKAVIIGDPKKDKSENLFRAFGRYVESLNGRYITAVDVGITPEDLSIVLEETDHVVGLPESYGSSGNPSPITSIGIHAAMKRTAKEAFGDPSLKGKKIIIQGCGNVAYTLCELLHEDGAIIYATDIDENSLNKVVEDFNAKPVDLDDIYGIEGDIFAPCALGGILNDDTIPQLKVQAICGSANNQLENIEKHGSMLDEKGIIYAPDYIVNSGGAINVADEINGYNVDRAIAKTKDIYNQLDQVFKIAKLENITTALAADRLAEQRISDIGKIQRIYL